MNGFDLNGKWIAIGWFIDWTDLFVFKWMPMVQECSLLQLIIDSGFYLYLEAIPFIDMQMSSLLTVRRMLREKILFLKKNFLVPLNEMFRLFPALHLHMQIRRHLNSSENGMNEIFLFWQRLPVSSESGRAEPARRGFVAGSGGRVPPVSGQGPIGGGLPQLHSRPVVLGWQDLHLRHQRLLAALLLAPHRIHQSGGRLGQRNRQVSVQSALQRHLPHDFIR